MHWDPSGLTPARRVSRSFGTKPFSETKPFRNSAPHATSDSRCPHRRPYSRLALLALFPSLVAVDATDITLEEKRLAETMSSGNSSVTVMTNPVASGSSGWTPSAPGLGTGQSTLGSSGSGTGPGVAAMIRGPSTVPGGRRDYFTVGAIGSVVRASSGVPQGNGMNG